MSLVAACGSELNPGPYLCGSDCTDFEEGWNWAADADKFDAQDCDRLTGDMLAGCIAFTIEADPSRE